MVFFPHRHLIGIKGLTEQDITFLLDKADEAVKISRQREKKTSTLRGLTQINLFFEASTRTQASFELAGKRLGADVMNMSVGNSSVKKGETLIDTAMTLNAMRPDVLVVRHSSAGAAALLAQKVACSVVNAGDGQHEHPTQALLDALTIRRAKGKLSRIIVAICGDVLHSRVARSNILLLNAMGARVRVVAPATLLPSGIAEMGCEVFHDMKEGLKEVVWSGGNLADDEYDEFVVRGSISGDLTPGDTLYFAVVQECAGGLRERWIEIPAEGKTADDLEMPAPGVKLLDKAAGH